MFNAATFKLASATQEMLSELKLNVPNVKFGLFSETPGIAPQDITTIAFGAMEGGVKRRHGSVVIEDDYILILAMDGQEEYRASDTWAAIYFLRKLHSSGFNWSMANP